MAVVVVALVVTITLLIGNQSDLDDAEQEAREVAADLADAQEELESITEQLAAAEDELESLPDAADAADDQPSDPDGFGDPDADIPGDDAYFDALYDRCAEGDLAACDELFLESPIESEYERFGATCGDRFTLDDAPLVCASADIVV